MLKLVRTFSIAVGTVVCGAGIVLERIGGKLAGFAEEVDEERSSNVVVLPPRPSAEALRMIEDGQEPRPRAESSPPAPPLRGSLADRKARARSR